MGGRFRSPGQAAEEWGEVDASTRPIFDDPLPTPGIGRDREFPLRPAHDAILPWGLPDHEEDDVLPDLTPRSWPATRLRWILLRTTAIPYSTTVYRSPRIRGHGFPLLSAHIRWHCTIPQDFNRAWSAEETSPPMMIAGKSCPVRASATTNVRASGWTGKMSPYPTVVRVMKLK